MCSPLRVHGLKALGQSIFAWIEVAGKKASLYGSNVEGKVVSAFVESKVGEEFAVGLRLGGGGRPKHDISAEGQVDGLDFKTTFQRANDGVFATASNNSLRTKTLSGMAISKTAERRLVFAPIEFTANPNFACRDQSILNGLGAIKLTLRYGTLWPNEVSHSTLFTRAIDQSPLSEGLKDELGMTERAQLGRMAEVEPITYHTFSPVHGEAGKVCEFKFFYRSRDILEQKGFIARESPSPVAATGTLGARHSIRYGLDQPLNALPEPAKNVAHEHEIRFQLKRMRREQDELEQLLSLKPITNA